MKSMRRLLSLALCLSLCLAVLPATAGAAFSDISDPTVAVAAAALQGMGVVSGTTDTVFSPSSALTRAQVCAMVVNAAGLSSQVSTYARRTLFSDVPASAWYNGYVNLAYSQGLINGNGDGTFSPSASVTYGELATILLRMLGYTSAEVGTLWPLDYTAFCEALGLADGLDLDPYGAVTRGKAAVLLYRTLKTPVSGSEQPYYETISGVAATAATVTAAGGTSYRISSGAVVISGGEIYDYSTSGYLQINARSGKSVRLYYDDSGAITYLYLAGGTSSSSTAAVASTNAAASSLARALGISGQTYAITKNGASASSGDLARYDVGYYDAVTGTLRVSDYRVSGFLSAATPSVTAATTITVAGYTFDVLESAWETLGAFALGDKVTLLLTDDGKVAAAYATTAVSADMVGVLAEDGRSVTLVGSGITLTADTVDYEEADLGGLVTVTASSASTLRCRAVSSASGSLDLAAGTLGSAELAPSCAVFEWAGNGCVCDLDGNRGTASSDFDAITWTDTLEASDIAYYHTNSAGQVDVILLEDVTGSCYTYGKINLYSAEDGINLGDSNMNAYNPAATLTNSDGRSEKYLCAISTSGNSYVGIALAGTNSGYERVTNIRRLRELEDVDAGDFFQQDGNWYVETDGDEYLVSSQVQIHLIDSDLWLSGETGLTTILADGYNLTLYYDRSATTGGQIRVIAAE